MVTSVGVLFSLFLFIMSCVIIFGRYDNRLFNFHAFFYLYMENLGAEWINIRDDLSLRNYFHPKLGRYCSEVRINVNGEWVFVYNGNWLITDRETKKAIIRELENYSKTNKASKKKIEIEEDVKVNNIAKEWRNKI